MSGKLAATGSIRGFSTIDLGQGQTVEQLAPTHFSLAELRKRIEEIRTKYDPDALNDLITTVLSHIQNLNNPHVVTLSQTDADVLQLVYQAWLSNGNSGTLQDFYVSFFSVADSTIADATNVETASPTSLVNVSGANELISIHNASATAHAELIDIILPGIPPNAPPTISYNAQYGLPSNTTCIRASELTVLDQNGNLTTISENTIAVDYSTGVAAFPIYGSRTNLIFPSNPIDQNNTNLLNVTSSTSPSGTLKVAPDGNPAMVLTDTETNAVHGYEISITLSDAVEYTDTVFIYPLTNTGGITIYLDAYPDIAIMLDLSDYTIFSQNSSVQAYVQPLMNGWLRLGIQYTAPTLTTCNLVIAQVQTAIFGTSIAYEGTGSVLFGLFGLQHVAGCGMSPYIPTTTEIASHDSTIIKIPMTLSNAAEGMLSITYEHAFSAGSQTRSLLSLDNTSLIITTTNNTLTAITENTDESTTSIDINDVFNQQVTLGFSYSSTERELATTNITSVTQTSTNIFLALDVTIQLGSATTPWDGSISNFILYPIADSGQMLEFLIGEV